MKILLYLTLIWTQADMANVQGWHVWRVDSSPWHIEATVYGPSYNLPMKDAMAFYTVSSFGNGGDSFAEYADSFTAKSSAISRLLTPRMK